MSLEETPDYRKRKRTSHACDPCRYRKVRCDGRHPCTTCANTGEECVYGTEAVPKNKSDLILEVAVRSERLLQDMSAQLVAFHGVDESLLSTDSTRPGYQGCWTAKRHRNITHRQRL